MKVELLSIPKNKAHEEYEAYKEEIKQSKTQFNKDMLSLYAHMRHGGKVIDIYEAMKLAGINKDGDPKLAIVQADSKRVQFRKAYRWENGQIVADGGSFYRFRNEGNRWDILRSDVVIPKDFFIEWAKGAKGNILRGEIETITPVIPAKIMNPLRSHKLENYHILWEVDKWEPIPPRDPILLKRITPNMFLVLATWNLSKLERAVIQGRIKEAS